MKNWLLLIIILTSLMGSAVVFWPQGIQPFWLKFSCKRADLSLCKFCLSMGADPNYKDIYGWTPLMHALPQSPYPAKEVLQERKEIIETLIAHGASLCISNRKGHSIVHIAADRRLVDFLSFLKEKGAVIDQPSRDGVTPLMRAIDRRREKVTRKLIDLGANIDARDKKGNTALHHAVKRNKKELVREFLNKGASANVLNAKGQSPLILSILKNRKACFDIFKEEGVDFSRVIDQGWKALHFASEKSQSIALDILKSCKDEDVDAKTEGGLTPLHIACANKKSKLAKALLKRGASPSSLDKRKRSPLWYAICVADIPLSLELIKSGAPLNKRDSTGATVLHLIAKSASEDLACLISFMIEKGAKLEVKDDKGNTPLHLAAKSKVDFAFEELLLFGASRTVKNDGGKTPAQLSKSRSKRKKLARVSENSTPNEERLTGPPLYAAVRSSKDQLLASLLKRKKELNLNESNRLGRTALHYAAELGQEQMVSRLLKAGAKRNVEDSKGKTPADLAKKKGYQDLAKRLEPELEKG